MSFEDDKCWDAHDIELPGGFGVLVDVELEDFHFAFVLRGQLIDDRAHHFAGAAPRCPEIDEHGDG